MICFRSGALALVFQVVLFFVLIFPASAQTINEDLIAYAGEFNSFSGDLVCCSSGVPPISGTPPTGTTVNFNSLRYFINLFDPPAGLYNFSFDIGTYTIVVALEVRHRTSVAVTSSVNPSWSGQSVIFAANVTPATATGDVVFSIDGVDQPAQSLTAGVARLTTTGLAVGNHQITARYLGDAEHFEGNSVAFNQTVNTANTVTIRQESGGDDDVFSFTSDQPELNVSIATQAGSGSSGAIQLPPGNYTVTAKDMTGAGYALTALYCSDDDSSVDLAQRTAKIQLSANEAVTCTFTSRNSKAATTPLIEDFMTARAEQLLANQPDISRRINRLNGLVSQGGPSVSSLMGYAANLEGGAPISVSGSLSAIEAATGNAEMGALDVWMEGTFARLSRAGKDGTFSSASFGGDYLVGPDLLVGGFVQIDRFEQASVEGVGWLAGPYMTARLSDGLFLDLLAGAGMSANSVSPYGTYTDSFDATRFLLSAALQGDLQIEDWTISPRARLSYFEETSGSYLDGRGVPIPSLTVGVGQLAVGPGLSYRFATDGKIDVRAGIRFDGVLDLVSDGALSAERLHGRVEGMLDLAFEGGARIALLTAYDGIGGSNKAASIKANVAIPVR